MRSYNKKAASNGRRLLRAPCKAGRQSRAGHCGRHKKHTRKRGAESKSPDWEPGAATIFVASRKWLALRYSSFVMLDSYVMRQPQA